LKSAGDLPIAEAAVRPGALAELLALVDDGTLSTAIAREVFDDVWRTGESARVVVLRRGLAQVGDESALAAQVAEVLAKFPSEVAEARAGRANVLGFLVGQVLRHGDGKANPKLVADLVRRAVNAG
jgi:aspartyl-tRNA(Asn)/glutamyl-tRNA(Gln) amidotransferase subunit B